MRYKYLFFAISLLVILPGLYSLARYGLRPSIDFTGGTLLEVKTSDPEQVKKLIEVSSIQKTGNDTYIFRTKPMTNEQKDKLGLNVVRFETVGPVIGKELALKSIQAVVLASIAIVIYIAYAFREIPKPYSPWKFGISAVVALLHDVLVVVGVFSLLGHYVHVEIDSLFVTALLTIIGFSVHDTIVVFDRIRENLNRSASKIPFTDVVNESVIQTLARSLTTSLTVLFTLLALILFGGETIRWFVVALFVGVFSGTYSSIFNAAPLLVLWEEMRNRKK